MQAGSYRTRIYQSVSKIFISVPSLKTYPTVRRAVKTVKRRPMNPYLGTRTESIRGYGRGLAYHHQAAYR